MESSKTIKRKFDEISSDSEDLKNQDQANLLDKWKNLIYPDVNLQLQSTEDKSSTTTKTFDEPIVSSKESKVSVPQFLKFSTVKETSHQECDFAHLYSRVAGDDGNIQKYRKNYRAFCFPFQLEFALAKKAQTSDEFILMYQDHLNTIDMLCRLLRDTRVYFLNHLLKIYNTFSTFIDNKSLYIPITLAYEDCIDSELEKTLNILKMFDSFDSFSTKENPFKFLNLKIDIQILKYAREGIDYLVKVDMPYDSKLEFTPIDYLLLQKSVLEKRYHTAKECNNFQNYLQKIKIPYSQFLNETLSLILMEEEKNTILTSFYVRGFIIDHNVNLDLIQKFITQCQVIELIIDDGLDTNDPKNTILSALENAKSLRRIQIKNITNPTYLRTTLLPFFQRCSHIESVHITLHRNFSGTEDFLKAIIEFVTINPPIQKLDIISRKHIVPMSFWEKFANSLNTNTNLREFSLFGRREMISQFNKKLTISQNSPLYYCRFSTLFINPLLNENTAKRFNIQKRRKEESILQAWAIASAFRDANKKNALRNSIVPLIKHVILLLLEECKENSSALDFRMRSADR